MAATMFAPVPSGSTARPVPGEPGLPVLGVTPQLLRDPLAVMRRQHARHGPVTWYRAYGQRQVTMFGAEATEAVLANRDKAFGHGWDPILGAFFHRGLLLMDFEEHLHHRRIMQAAFGRDQMRGYLERMQPGIVRSVAGWQPGPRFRAVPALKRLLLDSAAITFMNARLGPEADEVNTAFVDAVRAPFALVRRPVPGGRWARGLRARRLLEGFFQERLAEKRRGSETDLFSVLCRAETDDGERFTDEDVVNHMIFLLMAAHETTTSTLSSMVYFLAAHPEWQERLRAESLALGDRLEYADMDRLPSCDLVMRESTRMVPPIIELVRRTVRDTEVLGHFVPQGTQTSVPLLFNHYDERHWPDPYRWDPERFAEHRREDRAHRYAWAPFGGGVHKCIGMHFAGFQVKTVLHALVRRFRWRPADGYRHRVDWSSLPMPARGLPLRLEPVAARRRPEAVHEGERI